MDNLYEIKKEQYMYMAIQLAKKAIGKVSPNPLVGAVIVKDGEIIGSGFHQKYGGFHAERNAINSCKKSPKDSTIYVTLEPCCHYGKTPPCTMAIIESGIKKVVVGCLDVNEKMAGKGIKTLQDSGIEVEIGVLEEECRKLNNIFFHYITNKTPYVLMKYAMTMDGKIATNTGASKWISNEKSREHVHKLRAKYSAIMVGVNTVLTDNPELTCRIKDARNPIRIICDSTLKTPLDSKIVSTAKQVKTIIATINLDKAMHKTYEEKGVEIIVTSEQLSQVNLKELMFILGEKGIDSILLEGGATLNFSALNSQIVNKIMCYIAPKIFGGEKAKSPVMGEGFSAVNNKIQLKNQKIKTIENDVLIESEVHYVHRDC